jgi:DNA (cytosine-5)-methyltransferase 1
MSGAYYNEIDEFAAQWLRNLIGEGLIAPGEVDTRSIEDVHPDDLRGFTQCHFFAGIGVWSYALRRAGMARRPAGVDRIVPVPAFQRGRQKRRDC